MKLVYARQSWITLLFAAGLLLLLSQLRELGSVAGRIPLVVLVLALVLCFAQLGMELSGRRTDMREQTLARPWRALVWVLALPVLVLLVGVVGGTGVFAFLFLRWQAKEPWIFSFAYALCLSTAIYLVFGLLFDATLYSGWLLR